MDQHASDIPPPGQSPLATQSHRKRPLPVPLFPSPRPSSITRQSSSSNIVRMSSAVQLSKGDQSVVYDAKAQSTGSPTRPPRRRPVQLPSPALVIPGAPRRPSYQRENRYIPDRPESTVPDRFMGRLSDKKPLTNSCRNSIRLFPDDRGFRVELPEPRANSDIDKDASDKRLSLLPSIFLSPPSPQVNEDTQTSRSEDFDGSSPERNAIVAEAPPLQQPNEPVRTEFSREVAELLVGWTPWAYASLGPTNGAKTEQALLQDGPRSSNHEIRTLAQGSDSVSSSDLPHSGLSIRWRLKRFRLFGKRNETERVPPRKLKKPRPSPKSQKESGSRMTIELIPESQNNAEAVIKATYSNIISKASVDPSMFTPTRPRLISLETAQNQEAQRQLVGLAR